MSTKSNGIYKKKDKSLIRLEFITSDGLISVPLWFFDGLPDTASFKIKRRRVKFTTQSKIK